MKKFRLFAMVCVLVLAMGALTACSSNSGETKAPETESVVTTDAAADTTEAAEDTDAADTTEAAADTDAADTTEATENTEASETTAE